MIIDSNLVIYGPKPGYEKLRQYLRGKSVAVSAISLVEVLGYHKLTDSDRNYFEGVFKSFAILPLTDAVVASAVALRQSRKMSLGDALIAATALIARRTLLTHNVKDFAWIAGLTVVDPLAAGDTP